jgi:hypothetical protein
MASAKSVTLAGFGLAGAALGVAATLTLQTLTTEVVNFVPDGTTSGAVIQVNGVTEIQVHTVSCTATGGNVKVGAGAAAGAKYDTCIMPPILTTTGAIKEVSVAVVGSETAVGIDCGFVKGRVSGTGAAFTNLGNVNTGTGLIFRFGTGSLRWNSADYIKCGTLSTLGGSGKGFSAKLRVQFYDDQSE